MVRLGEWDTNTPEDCIEDDCADPHQDIPVETIIVHEGYEPKNMQQHNDIALIRLKNPAKLNYFVKPICLPSVPELRAKLYTEEDHFVVAGWGRTEYGIPSNIKLKVALNAVNNEKCAETYSSFNLKIIDTQMCAGGEQGKDSCNGDSGGPLMAIHSDKHQKIYKYLVGIVSFGPRQCGTSGIPGIYTHIAKYIDWIESKIRP